MASVEVRTAPTDEAMVFRYRQVAREVFGIGDRETLDSVTGTPAEILAELSKPVTVPELHSELPQKRMRG